ncbi:MAG: PspC domain-containing protein [Gemmatimonadetes bacterium]|nr:PspC domain-containing protein [Gemmatimonadota bacterium]
MEVFRHRRLYRLREGKKIFGVCNGLADAFDLDPTLVRIGFFIAFLFSVGTVTLIYLFMAFVMPEGRPERPAQDD